MAKKSYIVTKDSSANYKSLHILEKKGLIIISKVKIENEVKKIKKVYLPTAVFGHTKFGESIFGSEKQAENFEKIKQIIGPNNIKDAILVSTHIREGNDFCVTEDTDILSNKEILEKTFLGLRISHPNKLLEEIENINV
ncbi:hypothetical protein HYW54_04185 [Candidatus Gottesmanbacteria bacterium]|nr:hypothetical protein [Candidatus Gottesmanbacteria bacterium]